MCSGLTYQFNARRCICRQLRGLVHTIEVLREYGTANNQQKKY